MTTKTKIDLPTAEQLDTGDYSETSGCQCQLYLIPAAETDDGIPEVVIHRGIGNIGWPMPAYHGRWRALLTYGAKVVGESVREHLEGAADTLVAISDCYQGSEWDGNNWRGQWDTDEIDALEGPYGLLDGVELATYWDLAEWLLSGGAEWPDLCRDLDVEPELALGDDWRERARALGDEAIEYYDGENPEVRVCCGADGCEYLAERWREALIEDTAAEEAGCAAYESDAAAWDADPSMAPAREQRIGSPLGWGDRAGWWSEADAMATIGAELEVNLARAGKELRERLLDTWHDAYVTQAREASE